MKTVLFATGNEKKLKEAIAGCEGFDIKIEQVKLQIDEIQSHDPSEISLHKANSAFKITKKPTIISDTSWNIPSLNGFPGGYMKDVANWFSAEDFLNLMKNKEDRRVCFIETLVYKDVKQIKVFSKEFWEEFTNEPKGKDGFSIKKVAKFNGFTIAEKRDQGKLSHEVEDYIWIKFPKWFSNK